MKNKKLKGFFQNIMLLFFVILLCLIMFELFLKFFMPQPCYAYPRYLYVEGDKNCYELAKNVNTRLNLPDFKTEIKTNSIGLRDYEYLRKPSQTTILGLGDSMQFGFGTAIEDTYLKLIEKRLNSEAVDKSFAFVNAAVPGYGTLQELNYLKDKGLKLNPDVVLVSLFVGNDFGDNLKKDCPVIKDGYLVEKGVSKIRIFLNKLNSYCLMKEMVFKIPALRNLVYTNSKISTTDIFAPVYSGWMEDAVLATKKDIQEINEISLQNNIKLVLIIIPDRVQVETETWNSITQKYQLNGYDPAKPNNILAEFAENNSIHVIDLLPEFQKAHNEGKMLYFETDNHINENGHALIAEVLYRDLINSRIIPKP